MTVLPLGYSPSGTKANVNLDTVAADLASLSGAVTPPYGTVPSLPSWLANAVWVSVANEGADPTGAQDSTAAINAAISHLTNGGVVYFPPGIYKCNLVVTAPDIQFVGSGGMGVNVALGALIAADTTKPVLTVGDGTTNCDGFGFTGLQVSAQGGGIPGVKIGGASRCSFHNFAIKGFAGQGLYITSSATVPSDYLSFSHFSIEAGSGAGAVAVDLLYGAQYVTALNFVNGHVSGPNTGLFAMQNNGCIPNLTDVWFQCANGKGLNSLNVGIYVCKGVVVDSANSTDVLLQADADVVPSQRWQGGIQIDGVMQTTDGNSAQLTPVSYHFPDSTLLNNPFIQNALYFTDAALAQYQKCNVSDKQVSLNRNGTQLFYRAPQHSIGASTDHIGFFGVSEIARPLLATGASHTVDDVITVLQNLGLVRQS